MHIEGGEVKSVGNMWGVYCHDLMLVDGTLDCQSLAKEASGYGQAIDCSSYGSLMLKGGYLKIHDSVYGISGGPIELEGAIVTISDVIYGISRGPVNYESGLLEITSSELAFTSDVAINMGMCNILKAGKSKDTAQVIQVDDYSGQKYISLTKEHKWESNYSVDKEASCIEEGEESIHCAVCDEIDETTITVIPKIDHAYGEWKTTNEANCVEDGSREKVCAYCQNKVTETIPAFGHTWKESYIIDKTATCTEEGRKSIHCAVCDDVKENSEVKIDATGHKWDKPTYLWTKNNSSVTATRTCRNDSSHKETESVYTRTEVTKEATYTEMGQTTYTAVFSNPVFAVQKRIENNIAKLQKKANPLVVKAKKVNIKLSKLKKRTLTIKASKLFKISNAKGKVIYKVKTFDKKARKKIKVSSAGNVKVSKGLKKGTYKVKVYVTATGNSEYTSVTKTITLTIKVK